MNRITIETGEAPVSATINNNAVVSANNGTVGIDFNHKLKWIRFTPDNAKKFAHDILGRAKEAKKQLENKKKK